MARVRLIHSKPDEARTRVAQLQALGHEVEFENRVPPAKIRATQPDAVLIDLTRTPAHGREVAVYLRSTKASRHLPIVFVEGEPEKVAAIKAILPDAAYTDWKHVDRAIKAASKQKAADVVVPTPIMQRYGNRSVAEKLGIKAGMKVGVIDPPSRYESLIAGLPDNVTFLEEENEIYRLDPDLTLWFVRDIVTLQHGMRNARRLVQKANLWIVWPKAGSSIHSDLTQPIFRKVCLDAGLVDYKICAVNSDWSAMLFAPAKSAKSK